MIGSTKEEDPKKAHASMGSPNNPFIYKKKKKKEEVVLEIK